MEKGLNNTPSGLLVTENFALAKRDEICSAKQEPRAKTFLLWSMPSANFAISISVRNFTLLMNYLLIFAHESFSVTVRLNTKCSAVESVSGQK